MFRRYFERIDEDTKYFNNKKLCSWFVKAVLRKITGLNKDVFYLMAKDLNEDIVLPQRDDLLVKEISIADIDDPNWMTYSGSVKKNFYQNLKSIAKYNTYGAFVNGKLAWLGTIVWDKVLLSDRLVFDNFEDCGFGLDAYCHPDFRGRGIHTYMNLWRLKKIASTGRKKAFVFIHTNSILAMRTQKKCGLKIEKTFRVITWRKHTWVKIR